MNRGVFVSVLLILVICLHTAAATTGSTYGEPITDIGIASQVGWRGGGTDNIVRANAWAVVRCIPDTTPPITCDFTSGCGFNIANRGWYYGGKSACSGCGGAYTYTAKQYNVTGNFNGLYVPDDEETATFSGCSLCPDHHVDQDWGISITVFPAETIFHTLSGSTTCISEVVVFEEDILIYVKGLDCDDSYSCEIVSGANYTVVFSDGTYYGFTCDGNEVFNYDACIWVYGYTCGVDTIKLRDSNSQLIETGYQDAAYDTYEMQITDGMEYTISFYDMGTLLCYDQTFTCTGDDVLIDFDRCNWVWPPSPWAPPITIYIWAGYDYNIVVFKDDHGNFIENSQLAIYDKTDGQYIQRWEDVSDGYTLLGARFDTDHDVLLTLRTFDGIFTLDTTYPANGSAQVGEEDITTTNWTVPINYNLNLYPETQDGKTVFGVFCGLSEYTPLSPGSFWGMDLSDQGYVAVTNCSGFAMCDIIAAKDGYVDYKVEALNWTSKSALVKDYRHNVVMEEE